MKLIFTILIMTFTIILGTSCSKTPDDPYFDRAKQASQDAQTQLRKD